MRSKRRCAAKPGAWSALEGEVGDPEPAPVRPAEVEAGPEQPQLVADAARDKGRPRVAEDDALPSVQPARRLLGLGGDGADPEGQHPVGDPARLGVEDLAAP